MAKPVLSFDNPFSTKLCLCGHIPYYHDDEGICFFSPEHQRPSDVQCACTGFKLDNLKYLEEVLKEKEDVKA